MGNKLLLVHTLHRFNVPFTAFLKVTTWLNNNIIFLNAIREIIFNTLFFKKKANLRISLKRRIQQNSLYQTYRRGGDVKSLWRLTIQGILALSCAIIPWFLTKWTEVFFVNQYVKNKQLNKSHFCVCIRHNS